jgi:hypothetical protein
VRGQAVDRAERVGLEGDHRAPGAHRAREAAVPLPGTGVLARAAVVVATAAGAALVAHHGHQRHGAGRSRVEEAMDLAAHVRAREAAEPLELRLARDPPHELRPVALALAQVAAVLAPGGMLALRHVPALAEQRVRRAR